MSKEYILRSVNGIFYYKDKEKTILHREDGPAIELKSGSKLWYFNGNFHREDGPAIEWGDGTKEWYVNGKRHREDGPSIEHINGSREYWVNGKQILV